MSHTKSCSSVRMQSLKDSGVISFYQEHRPDCITPDDPSLPPKYYTTVVYRSPGAIADHCVEDMAAVFRMHVDAETALSFFQAAPLDEILDDWIVMGDLERPVTLMTARGLKSLLADLKVLQYPAIRGYLLGLLDNKMDEPTAACA